MSFLKKVKIVAGQGAGVTVNLVDCTVFWDEEKQEFEPTKCHAILTAAYNSVDTSKSDAGYSDALEVELHPPEDQGDRDHLTKSYSVTIDENDDLYEIDSPKKLVLSAGWTRAKFSKGDVFQFRVTKDGMDIEGTAMFTQDGEYAWADLDNADEEEEY